MKKIVSFVTALAPLVFAGTPQFPFPQNTAYPFGNTFKSADTDKIYEHFTTWKKAWYTEAGTYYQKYEGGTEDANAKMPSKTARVISPDAHSERTVSEGIGYGMLLMVYMSTASNDLQSEFDKLWQYWKCYGNGLNGNGCTSWKGQGMEWEIDNEKGVVIGGGGTASDAEFDAAVALIMASKQWNNPIYLSEAKQLINWIKSNDMESDGRIKPGSNWNPAFNPSYSAIAAFKLFKEVTNDTFWDTAISTTLDHLRKCQDAKTGLMPDWCDWSTHKVTNAGQVSGGSSGFYDDAARTPWRIAWGYAWYGDKATKEVNDAIIGWLDTASYGYAGMILPGYKLDGTSSSDVFVSSTYAGGLGLSMLSADAPKAYLENLYYTLINTEGKESLTASIGENYFAATLNVLYLLTLTGNLPNLYNNEGFTKFTPNPKDVQTPSAPAGTLQTLDDHASVSGFEFWGAYADKFGETKMYPDSGSTAIYKQDDGSNMIAISAYIAPEPAYDPSKDLKYPFAGVACSFAEDHHYFDLSDLATVRVIYKSEGVMRFALLDQESLTQNQEGAEPGYYLQPTTEWKSVDIDITGDNSGNFKALSYPSWANFESSRADVLKAVRGLKFDVKMAKAGYASFALKGVSLLDASGNVITELKDINTPIAPTRAIRQMEIQQHGEFIVYQNLSANAQLQVFDLNGQALYNKRISKSGVIPLSQMVSASGKYLVRVRDNGNTKIIRISR